MAFQSIKSYNDAKFSNLFILRDDGDYADVIFLYRSADEVLVADAHYIKSSEYSGYVHCCGPSCPACAKGIRVQTKLFIPVYNLTAGEVQFWDRTLRFEPQLNKDVFMTYPNPSEIVFRIVRHGAAGDINTTYQIQAIGSNKYQSYDEILANNHIAFPDHYEVICRDVPANKLYTMLSAARSGSFSPESAAALPEYHAIPRTTVSAQVPASIAEYSAPPANVGAFLNTLDAADSEDVVSDPEDAEESAPPF